MISDSVILAPTPLLVEETMPDELQVGEKEQGDDGEAPKILVFSSSSGGRDGGQMSLPLGMSLDVSRVLPDVSTEVGLASTPARVT